MNASFYTPPQRILREILSGDGHLLVPGGQWLPGAFGNPAKNCLIVNRKRSLNDTMVIWRNEGNDDLPLNKMTLKELRTEVWYDTFDPLSFFMLKSFWDLIYVYLFICTYHTTKGNMCIYAFIKRRVLFNSFLVLQYAG